MTLQIDCLVVGAGVVGLAIARALQIAGRETVLIDRERSFGMHTSSRNSEVIHAGIYYKQNSLKAKHCVRGRHMLYEYCSARNVPYRKIGKILVACDNQEEAALLNYLANADANGVDDLQQITKTSAERLEPYVVCNAAIISPSTGIIDSHQYMLALLADFESFGGHFVPSSGLERGTSGESLITLWLQDGTELHARWMINAAGLSAPKVASLIEGLPDRFIPRAYFAIGHYFSLTGKSPFSRLVYPVARSGGLGVHATLDMAGSAKFGPDITWIDNIDYSFNEARATAFVEAIRAYYPALDRNRLVPSYTGIRPKIVGPGEPDGDFVIQGPADHGVVGLVNLFGIESPGLTASLSIASMVNSIVEGKGS